MTPLDFGDIEKAGSIAYQQTSWKTEARDRLPATFAEGTCPICHTSSPFKQGADGGMGFEALKLFKWAEVGVAVIQSDHETNRDTSLIEMIYP